MSHSQHPVALSVERLDRGPTGLLGLVMVLPLIDGLFPAMVLAGGLDYVGSILSVGLLGFGGSATLQCYSPKWPVPSGAKSARS
jgi:hypothetical protein